MPAAYHPELFISQNYLKDPQLVARLLDRSSIGPGDTVYEIGPGKGIITAQLAKCCKQVIAIEKDPALSACLQQQFAGLPNLVIETADFLDYPLPRHPYKVFANIPFNLTSAIVTRLTATARPPDDIYLVMQKEAAQMYLGVPRHSMRSVLLQAWFELELIHRFQRFDFIPQPHVDAVLLRMRKRCPPLVEGQDREFFRDFVAFGFTGSHPKLGGIFKEIFSYRQLKCIRRNLALDLNVTPTALHPEQWLGLFESFKTFASPRAVLLVSGSEKRLQHRQRKLVKIHRTRLS